MKIAKFMQSNNMNLQYQKLIKKILNDPDISLFLKQNKDLLSKSSFDRGVSKLYEFYITKNKNDIDYVPKLKFRNDQIEIEYEPSQKVINKQLLDKKKQLFSLLFLPDSLRNNSIDSFDQKGRETPYFKAIQFTNSLIENPTKFIKAPYFYGKFGVGKTYLLSAIANELAKNNFETLLVHVPTLVVELKNSITNNSLSELINKIRYVKILLLDDIGAENLSPWVRDDIFTTILQYRMDAQLITMFSSNFDFKQLETHFAMARDDYDVVKARRIIERIKFLSFEVAVNGVNRRI